MTEDPDAEAIQSITTKDGLTVSIDDYVYMTPDDPTEPYFIARVMEFVKGKTSVKLQIRVGWCYRPKDVLGNRRNKSYDPRLLLASMHSDLQPASCIRGVCTVKHQNHIPDLESYKQNENHFFYNQIYDRYTHRLYDVVPIEEARNLPAEARKAYSRYDFVVVEAGKGVDLTDNRHCLICRKWCLLGEAVRCSVCQCYCHMLCVKIFKRPAKGYLFECHNCLVRRENGEDENMHDVEAAGENGIDDHADGKAPKAQIKRVWPYRYYVENINLADLDDPNEDGSPKASSRIGKQYQVDVPNAPEDNVDYTPTSQQTLPQIPPPLPPPPPTGEVKNKGGRPKKKRPATEEETGVVPVRDTDAGLTFKLPSEDLEPKFEEYLKNVLAKVSGMRESCDAVDLAIEELHKANYDFDAAMETFSSQLDALTAAQKWTAKEIDAFETAIATHGHELGIAQKSVKSKSHKQVVAFFYHWKKTESYIPVYSQFCKIHRPGKTFKDPVTGEIISMGKEGDGNASDEESELSELEFDDYESDDDGSPHHECTNCGAHRSHKWRTIFPRLDSWSFSIGLALQKLTFCAKCTEYWSKYGVSRPIDRRMKDKMLAASKRKRQEVNEAAEKAQLTKKSPKVAKTVAKQKPEQGEAVMEPEIPVCAVCLEPSGRLIGCSSCNALVHTGCYGLADTLSSYFCSRCANIRDYLAAVDYKCVLCANPPQCKRGAGMKMTARRNWAHVSCAVWVPEVTFSDASMQIVDCISSIDRFKWASFCIFCRQSVGCCIRCADQTCQRTFHVTCGMVNKCEFSIQVSKSPKYVGLQAIAFCPRHTQYESKVGVIMPGTENNHATTPVEESSPPRTTEDKSSKIGSNNNMMPLLKPRPEVIRRFVATQKVRPMVTMHDGVLASVRIMNEGLHGYYAEGRNGTDNESRRSERLHVAKRKGRKAEEEHGMLLMKMILTMPGTAPVYTRTFSEQLLEDRECGRCHSRNSPAWWSAAGVQGSDVVYGSMDCEQTEEGTSSSSNNAKTDGMQCIWTVYDKSAMWRPDRPELYDDSQPIGILNSEESISSSTVCSASLKGNSQDAESLTAEAATAGDSGVMEVDGGAPWVDVNEQSFGESPNQSHSPKNTLTNQEKAAVDATPAATETTVSPTTTTTTTTKTDSTALKDSSSGRKLGNDCLPQTQQKQQQQQQQQQAKTLLCHTCYHQQQQ